MKLRRSVKQCIVLLLSFLMAFEPFAINMVRAQDSAPDAEEVAESVKVTEPDTTTLEGDDKSVYEQLKEMANKGEDESDSLMKPVDYLNFMYSLRGRSIGDDDDTMKKIENALIWGEWMNTITAAYAMMDDGCSDVFTYYNTLGVISSHVTNAPEYLKAVKFATNKAFLAGAFIAKVTGIGKIASNISSKVGPWLKSKGNLMKGFNAMGRFFGKGLKGANTFITHLSPPAGVNGKLFGKTYKLASGEGTVSYWRWVARKTGIDATEGYAEAIKKINKHLSAENQINYNKGSSVISNTKGVATTIGIGLTIVGIACDSYGIITSEDRQGGRYGSYALVKNYVGLALGVLSLVAMFCVPVVGQVIAICAAVWTVVTLIADQFGKHHKKWKEAYKNSFQFMFENDPKFKSFYENRDSIVEDEKSAAYILTERNYGDYKQAAREFEKYNRGQNNYYDDKSETAVNSRAFIELEKQGVLTSYYNRIDYSLSSFNIDDLVDLWKAKASYMSWKPTEEESTRAKNRGFWGNLGHAINPMTYISWVGDKVSSIKYNKYSKEGMEKAVFNPDFVLLKKYQAWVTANRLIKAANEPNNNNDFYRAIGLRIEQAPFNYIPLVAIDTAGWDNDLLIQAFNADSFIVGVKEMMYFRNVIGAATNNVKEFTKNVQNEMKDVKKKLDYFDHSAKALFAIRNAYKDFPDDTKTGAELLDNEHVKKVFGWKKSKKYTPREIVAMNWNDIDRVLTVDTTLVSQKGADIVLLLDTIKRNLDLAVLMQELYDEKQDAIESVDSDFRQRDFNAFIKKGKFLGVKGGGFLDWLADIYSPYDELKKYNKLYKKEIDKYSKAADDSNKGHKRLLGFLWTVEDEDYHPNTILGQINMTLDTYRKVAEEFETVAPDLEKDGLALTLSSSDDKIFPMKNGEYSGYETMEEVETLSLDDEVIENNDPIMPPAEAE